MINFYRRFIKGAAAILKPLTDATRGPSGQQSKVVWTPDMQSAFERAKAALAHVAALAHPDENSQLALVTDASDKHVGAVLQQQTATGVWQPLAFFSRKLSSAEEKYSTFDRELLACVAAVRHFRYWLEGRAFHIQTDHKPLVHAIHRVSDPWSGRQQRHLSLLAEFTSDIRHVQGALNHVADALSRPACVVVPATSGKLITWGQIAEAQASDEDVQRIIKEEKLQLQHVGVDNVHVWCDVSTGVFRPLVPRVLRLNIFHHIHSLAHAGIKATCRLLTSRYVWPHMGRDMRAWCGDCVKCGRAKVTRQEKTPVQKVDIPGERFSHVHVDILGPWPPSRAGAAYILTMIDRSTRWPETCILSDISSDTVLEAFITTWVSRFGLPAAITTDRGRQFASNTWTSWCNENNVQHAMTTSFHPQANGMVERLHRQIKDALRARESAGAWADHLPWVLLGIRTAPKEESGVSAAEAALGSKLAVPGQLRMKPPSVPERSTLQHTVIPATSRTYAEAAKGTGLDKDCAWVYVRKGGAKSPLADNYDGPFKVLEINDKTVRIQLGSRTELVSRDRVKPHTGSAPVTAAEPPKRGRPPGTGGAS